jgi:hypothetical protein
VDPVPDPLLLRKSVTAKNRTWTSGSGARNSDHQTTEAVIADLTQRKTSFFSNILSDLGIGKNYP